MKKIFKDDKKASQAKTDKPIKAEVITEKQDEPKTAKPAVKKAPVIAAEKVKKVVAKVQKKIDPNAYKVLIKPLITEKATDLALENKYCFVVPTSVNKSEVAKTVMNLYGVKPTKINLILKRGKKVRRGRKFGRTSDFKKAIVTLAPEDKIELYEGV